MAKKNRTKDLETTKRALEVARDDVSNKYSDAVVRIESASGRCTGVLISSQIILTAGHCVDNSTNTVSGSRRKVWEWMKLQGTISVFFGNEMTSPKVERKATHYNSVGYEDIIMLRLDKPVASSVALPYRVLTRIPFGKDPNKYLKNSHFVLSGWGNIDNAGTVPRLRQTTSATLKEFPFLDTQIKSNNMMRVEGENFSRILGGDSGSPLIWISVYGHRFVAGIAQGTEHLGGRFVATFGKGGVTSQNFMSPDVASWIEHTLYSDILPDPDEVVPLFSLWNSAKEDNYTTSIPDMCPYPSQMVYGDDQLTIVAAKGDNIPHDDYLFNDYRAYRHEGYIFSPKQPQPAGTLPLFGWWNPERDDYLITSKPSWSLKQSDINWNDETLDSNGIKKIQGYEVKRLEGYVFDPNLPQPPDTTPLFSWWNASREDNHTTSNPLWGQNYMDKIQWNGEEIVQGLVPWKEGYKMYRLEGYIYPNLIL